MKFYICKHCGNIIAYVHSSGVPVVGRAISDAMGSVLAGLKMLKGTVGFAVIAVIAASFLPLLIQCCAYHLVFSAGNIVEGNKVTVRVGAVEHPMLPEHYIEWIALETAQGNQRKPLAPGQKPEAVFMLAEGDSVVAAYEYCNLHSLWKA